MSSQSIYAVLKATGINDIGACALMGNWEAESNCESIRVQGDINSSRNISKAYVKQIDNGKMTKTEFAKDSKGFGLAQWTYCARKENLYDFAQWQCISIGDEQMQVEFAIKELSNEFANLLAYLMTATDLYEATERVCKEYENPYDQSQYEIGRRYNYALAIKDELELTFGISDKRGPSYKNGKYPLLTNSISNEELQCVKSCQTLLSMRGFKININGYYDENTQNVIRSFQESHNLSVDGQCGSETWFALIDKE